MVAPRGEAVNGHAWVEGVNSVLPVGLVSVIVVKGSLDVPDEEAGDLAVIASAAVEVRLELS